MKVRPPIDDESYARDARYTPPPELIALREWPLIRTGWGGKGFGFDELDTRARAAAEGRKDV